MPINTDHGPVLYRFRLDQIKQAAEDLRATRDLIDTIGPSYYPAPPKFDLVGAISQVVGPSHYGTFDSRAVIAESILMHYFGEHPYTWEDHMCDRHRFPSPSQFDTHTHTGLFAYAQANQDVTLRRHQHMLNTLDQVVEWLNSDRFNGGTNGPQTDPEAGKESSDVGSHQIR